MEHLIYLIVKGASAIYILYKAYRLIFFGKRAAEFWQYIMPETKAVEKPAAQTKPEPAAYSPVGKSLTVYLEELPKEEVKVIKPAFSEDLEREKPYGEEPDITGSDVDDNLNDSPDREILVENERFLPLDTEPDGETVSTGMTFEQISQALDVIQGKQTDEAGRAAAARILYETEGGDVFNFLAAQAENEALVEKLLRENLDNNGVPPPGNTRRQKRDVAEFDMEKYV